MSTDLNVVTLQGRLTRDIELSTSNSGMPIGKFSIAVGYKDKNGEKTSFFNCVVFGKSAEYLSQYTGKGKRLSVSGRLDQQNYEDKQGNKRQSISIVCNNVFIIDFNENTNNQSLQQPQSQPQVLNNPFADTDVPF